MIVMKQFCCIILLAGVLIALANVHTCVRATRKIWKMGTGELPGACMSCDPTVQYCQSGCQKLVNTMYNDCDGVCLPDGYYFDPRSKQAGCWDDNKPEIKIAVERCGCNSAPSIHQFSISFILSAVLGAVFYLRM